MIGRLIFLCIILSLPVNADNTIIKAREEESGYYHINTLRSIFLLQSARFSSGEPVRVVMFDPKDLEAKLFARDTLGISPSKYRAIVETRLAAGGVSPVIVSSYEEMINEVLETPHSIGYLEQSLLVSFREEVVAVVVSYD